MEFRPLQCTQKVGDNRKVSVMEFGLYRIGPTTKNAKIKNTWQNSGLFRTVDRPALNRDSKKM